MGLPGVPDEFEELIPCSACPDGYVWNSNGPTSRPCPSCGGFAVVHLNGSKLAREEYERMVRKVR